MIEEWFDVVDEQDVVQKQLPRSVVHRDRLLHRAVHMFLFRSDGCLLIHQRSPLKEEFPSVWTSSASGHVSAGETYDESAARELQEELGISTELQRLGKFSACPETSYEFTVLYRGCDDQPVDYDPQEMTAVLWLLPDDLSRWLEARPEEFSPAFRLLFEWYRRSFRT